MLIFECDICHKQEEYDENNYRHTTFRKITLKSLCEQCFQDLAKVTCDRIIRLIPKNNYNIYGFIYFAIQELIRYENDESLCRETTQKKIQEIFNELPDKKTKQEINKTIQEEDVKRKTLEHIEQLKQKYLDGLIIEFYKTHNFKDWECSMKGCSKGNGESYTIFGHKFKLCFEHNCLFHQKIKEYGNQIHSIKVCGEIYDYTLLDFIFSSYQDENIDFNNQIPF